MTKKILFIILLQLNSYVYAQFNISIRWQAVNAGRVSDTIPYQADRKLTWSDFKGSPDGASPAAAITESGFGYRLSMQSFNKKTDVVITVFCYFNKMKSWYKKGMDTDYGLLHEQHHFDITYINTCQFIKNLQAAQFNAGNYNYLLQKIHDESYAALSKMQDEYDGQTLNGRITGMQSSWNKKIDRLLKTVLTN